MKGYTARLDPPIGTGSLSCGAASNQVVNAALSANDKAIYCIVTPYECLMAIVILAQPLHANNTKGPTQKKKRRNEVCHHTYKLVMAY